MTTGCEFGEQAFLARPTALALMGWDIGWPECLIILLMIIVLFGAKRIPLLFRALGQSVGELKKGLAGRDEAPPKQFKKEPEVKR